MSGLTTPRLVALLQRPPVLLAAVFAVLVAVFALRRDADPDLFARVAVGRLIEATGEVPAQDPFAFTETKPTWVDHEWLSGVAFYHLTQLGGDAALFWFKCAMALLSLALLLRSRQEVSGDRTPAAFAFVYVALLCAYVWTSTVRAQVFTYALLPATFAILGRCRRQGAVWPLLLLPPMIALWAQLHGGFVLGLLVTAMYAIDRTLARRRDAVAAWAAVAASCAAVLLHPAGIGYVRYLIDALSMTRPEVPEWSPLPLGEGPGLAVVGLCLFFVASLGRARAGPPRFLALFALGALVFAVRHQRMVAVLAMTLYVALPRPRDGISWSRLRPAAQRAVTSGLAAGLLLAGPVGLALTASRWSPPRLDYARYPVAACEWLREHRDGGRVLCGFTEGSFVLWRLFPRFLVAVDGRYEEVYPDATVARARDAIDPRRDGHDAALAAIHPEFIVIATGTRYDDVPADRRFAPEWKPVYQDLRFLVLERRATAVECATREDAGAADDIWRPRF